MSTKIFDAYVFEGSKQELFDILRKYTNINEQRTKFLQNMVKSDIGYLITTVLTKANGDSDSLSKIMLSSKIEYDSKPNIFNREYHFYQENCAVIYNTQETKLEGKQLVQFFTSDKEFLKEIEKNNKFRDFYYTNQTDMDDISPEEENLREDTWNIIFSNSSVPGVVGETYSLYNFIDDYESNKSIVKDEIEVVLNDSYQRILNNNMKKIIDNIEIVLRCREIRRQEKNDSQISDSEDFGSVSDYLKILRKAKDDQENKVKLSDDLSSSLDSINRSISGFPKKLPQPVINSFINRLESVIDFTKEDAKMYRQDMIESGLESEISKPSIKLK